jgi:hypothetical protein
MAMSEELEVLKEVTRRLDRAKIAYMVTGSIATNFYTVPRMTRDIDIVVELSERGLSRFIPLFENDYYLEPETVRGAVKNKGMFNLIHDEYIIKIDFVVRKDTRTAVGNSPGERRLRSMTRISMLWRRKI